MAIEIESVDSERSLEEIAHDLAIAVRVGGSNEIEKLLLEFANEIKRQAIEP